MWLFELILTIIFMLIIQIIITIIPLHDAELRQCNVKDTNSIIQILPRPKVANLFGHSYVYIKKSV